MYNPRHSYLSTGTTNTYPSTLSPNATTPYPLTPPVSPQKPHGHASKLHRSSKRNLRTSVSVASLNPIKETRDRETRTNKGQDGDGVGRGNAGYVPLPVSDQPPSTPSKDVPRPASAAAGTVRQPNLVSQSAVRAATARPPSVLQNQHRPSSVRPGNIAAASTRPTIGLGITTNPSAEIDTRMSALQVVAKPKRPKPIDVNPRKKETESMADEWERELIHSARNFAIDDSRETARDKGKGKGVEWERAGASQADVDPLRDAEDRSRRDAKGERGKSQPLPGGLPGSN
jgi:hypothetical protein